MASSKQKLVFSFIKFLHQEMESLHPEKKESVEVAIQCLEASFDIGQEQEEQLQETEDLMTLFIKQLPEENHVEAEDFKNTGNELMRTGMYQEAVEQYTRAINLNPNNAVYFCNRAAAFSRLEEHDRAIADCEEAVKLDPNYVKAYGRLGIAYSSLNRYQEAIEAYKKALNIDPGNSVYLENMKLAEERLGSSSGTSSEAGQVDLGQFINNPSLLTMASQMLNDPGVRNMMSGILNMGNNEGVNPNIDVLLQMGQQLAHQMQANNPEFVNDLRRQFGTNADSQPANNSGNDQPQSDADKSSQPPDRTNGGDL